VCVPAEQFAIDDELDALLRAAIVQRNRRRAVQPDPEG
jgi:hypothetical protein